MDLCIKGLMINLKCIHILIGLKTFCDIFTMQMYSSKDSLLSLVFIYYDLQAVLLDSTGKLFSVRC